MLSKPAKWLAPATMFLIRLLAQSYLAGLEPAQIPSTPHNSRLQCLPAPVEMSLRPDSPGQEEGLKLWEVTQLGSCHTPAGLCSGPTWGTGERAG